MNDNQSDKLPRFELRPAREEDYRLAEKLYLETSKPLFLELGIWDERKIVSEFGQKYKTEEVRIISVNGVDAGWLQTSENDSDVHLIQIHLQESFRAGGIGSTIIRDLMRDVQSKGKGLSLFVFRNNPALALYRRLGFQIISEADEKLRMRWEPNQSSP